MNQGPEPEDVRAAAVAAVAEFVADAGVTAEELGDGRWFLRLAGERKLGIGVHLAVGDRTLRVESFFMRAPEEQRERLYRDLLLRQATSYVLRFTLDEAGDLFLVGQVPLRAVTAEEVDRVVGSVLDLADAAYLPAVEIGFASSIAAEKPGGPAWPRVPPFIGNSIRVILPVSTWTYASDQRNVALTDPLPPSRFRSAPRGRRGRTGKSG